MKIAVCIPVYCDDDYDWSFMDKALASVHDAKRQMPDIEFDIIVVDDASPLTHAFSHEINVIERNNENKGIGYTRNRLAQIAIERGADWISFLSHDDMYATDFFSKMAEYANLNPNCVLYSDYTNIGPNGEFMGNFTAPEFKSHQDFCMKAWEYAEKNDMFTNFGTLFIPRAALEKVPIEDYREGEDLAWVLKAMKLFHFVKVPFSLALYRRHPGQNINKVFDKLLETNKKVRADAKKWWKNT